MTATGLETAPFPQLCLKILERHRTPSPDPANKNDGRTRPANRAAGQQLCRLQKILPAADRLQGKRYYLLDVGVVRKEWQHSSNIHTATLAHHKRASRVSRGDRMLLRGSAWPMLIGELCSLTR